jgi:hypothetical protein
VTHSTKLDDEETATNTVIEHTNKKATTENKRTAQKENKIRMQNRSDA